MFGTVHNSGADFDLNYTDRPFVYDVDSDVRVPRNGFKGCGDSYVIKDAWLAEKDMSRFVVPPEKVLQLKTYFDRVNRRTNTKNTHIANSASAKYWQLKRERLRCLFNKKYFSLQQLAIRTRYRYNMRRYIITPPMRQCTHQYDTMLRRLCRLDGLSPQELQKKRIFLQRDTNWNNSAHVTWSKPRLKSSQVNDASLQKLFKALIDTELVNKSIKDQTQGGKSFLKQVVVPGKMLNSLYAKVLPDPALQPDQIGIPCHVMEGAFKDADMNKVAAIVKRDPVFSSDAITTFTKVVRNRYPYVTLPSEIITNKQLDFDGDTVSIMMVHSGRCYIETLMRLSAKIAMYCHFYRTRLTFSQTSGFRIEGFLRHIRETLTAVNADSCENSGGEEFDNQSEDLRNVVARYFGNTFAHCRHEVSTTSNVTQQLGETLLSLSQQYGPFVAYGFMMNVRSLSFTGYNACRIYPIGPDPKAMATHIAQSGSKGTKESVDRMFNVSTTKQSHSAETLEYAKTFIEAKSLIRKQGHNAKKMDTAFQNIIVNHDDHLTMRVNNVVYDLGHVINYMQREWIMSDLTVRCILEGVQEDEDDMRRMALQEPMERQHHQEAASTVNSPFSSARQRLLRDAPFGAKKENAGYDHNQNNYYYWDNVIEEALDFRPAKWPTQASSMNKVG